MLQHSTEKNTDHLQLLSVHEVLTLLKISMPTLHRMRVNDPTFPSPYKIAGERTLRYRVDQLGAWLESRKVTHEAG